MEVDAEALYESLQVCFFCCFFLFIFFISFPVSVAVVEFSESTTVDAEQQTKSTFALASFAPKARRLPPLTRRRSDQCSLRGRLSERRPGSGEDWWVGALCPRGWNASERPRRALFFFRLEKKNLLFFFLSERDSGAFFSLLFLFLLFCRESEESGERERAPRRAPSSPPPSLTSAFPPPKKKKLKASHPIFHSPLVRQAWSVAKVAHAGQARSAATPSQPLLEHCADVARAVAELLSGDAEAVAAAVLHEALGRGVATAGALAEVGVPEKVVALVSSVARMSDLCAVRRFTTGEASSSSSPSGSPVGSLAGGGLATLTTTAAASASTTLSTAIPPPSKADASAFVAMLLSMSDVRAVVIKLADRLCDLKSTAAAAVAEEAEKMKSSSSSPSYSSSLQAADRRAVADPTATA